MVSYTVKQTVVENLNADLDGKQPAGDYPTNASLTESLQSNLLNYTTNRILEIPQDIKLELNNGTLTLKAGSKVYVPNRFEADGTTPKFDVRIIENDIVDNNSGHNNTELLTVRCDGDAGAWLFWFRQDYMYSGPTAPTVTSTFAYWYDTANNLMKWTEDNGSTWKTEGYSFPIVLGKTNDSGATTSIDQVFNGFGYIGSTVFALPGVKVQIPDGKNEDNTYKSSIYTVDSVLTYNNFNSGSVNGKAVIAPDTENILDRESTDLQFDSNTGYMNRDIHRKSCIIANVSWTTSGIESFTPYSVDSLANSNASNFSKVGKSYLSGLSMPSNRYIELTLGATGTKYTAPANGWFQFNGYATLPDGVVSLIHQNKKLKVQSTMGQGGNPYLRIFLPCKAGDIVRAEYYELDTTKIADITGLFFVYAEGDQ